MKLFNKHNLSPYFYAKGWIMTLSILYVIFLLQGLIFNAINIDLFLFGVISLFILFVTTLCCDRIYKYKKQNNKSFEL